MFPLRKHSVPAMKSEYARFYQPLLSIFSRPYRMIILQSTKWFFGGQLRIEPTFLSVFERQLKH